MPPDTDAVTIWAHSRTLGRLLHRVSLMSVVDVPVIWVEPASTLEAPSPGSDKSVIVMTGHSCVTEVAEAGRPVLCG